MILLAWLATCMVGFGQITGRVLEEGTKEPLVGAIITIAPISGGKAIAYASTDRDGFFRVSLSGSQDITSLEVRCRLLGYKDQTIPCTKGVTSYVVHLKPEEYSLKEFSVSADRIREDGDTVRYLVSSFADISDKSLRDVLRKMPGIEIGKSGRIKYNGRSINKFYIEGKDLLGSKYGVATETLQADDVGSVEVLRNHEPIRALESLHLSDDPAINIRLRESAKKKWHGTLSLEGGARSDRSIVGELRGSVMRFSPSYQTLNTIGANNKGQGYGQMFREQTLHSALTASDEGPFNVSSGEASSLLGQKLTSLQGSDAHIGSSHLFATDPDAEVTLMGTYLREDHSMANRSVTGYGEMLGDSLISQHDVRMLRRKGTLSLGYQLNRADFYAVDNLEGSLMFD